MRGGLGTLVLQLTELEQVGYFSPGQVVEVELTTVSSSPIRRVIYQESVEP